VSILLMTFTCISQVTITSSNDTLICLPTHVAKEIIIDLEKGKTCKQENILLENNIFLLEKSIQYKDTLISSYQEKETIYQTQIQTYQQIDSLYIKQLKEKDEEIERHIKEKKYGLGGTILLILVILLI
jgi:hypothetical protein